MNKQSLKILLENVSKIISKEKEIKRIKGEDFNLFKISKIQYDEVNTHSSLIAELLNPNGSHYMGAVFLRLFIETLDLCEQLTPDIHTNVEVEKYIGRINETQTQGGRIDIFIEDKNNRTIVIENKIFADDQEQQLVRYKNYKKDNHTVLYLNLFGKEPDPKSIKKNDNEHLESGQDYKIISYKEHISAWLIKCEEKATSKPILRESIRQYRILINQLTNNMENNQQNEISKEIIKYIEASKLIKDNYETAINNLLDTFREEVLKKLSAELKDEYDCNTGHDIGDRFAQIWIHPKKFETIDGLHFGIETFNGNIKARGGVLFVGIINRKGVLSPELEKKMDRKLKLDKWWPQHVKIKFNGETVILSQPEFIKIISGNKKDELIDKIVSETKNFIADKHQLIRKNTSS